MKSLIEVLICFLIGIITAKFIPSSTLDVFYIIVLLFTFLFAFRLSWDLNYKKLYKLAICLLMLAIPTFVDFNLYIHDVLSSINLQKENIHMLSIVSIIIIYILVSCLRLIYDWLLNYNKKTIIDEPLDDMHFIERTRDYERMLRLIDDDVTFSIGLEGEWGTGKTYLIQNIAKKLKNDSSKYAVITIDCLACNIDKYLEYIIKEVDDLLWQNGKWSVYSKRLKYTFRYKPMDIIYDLCHVTNSTYTKLFEGMQNELLTLGKTVVIIVDDLDRINSSASIKTILYLGEKLCNTEYVTNDKIGKIKIVYLYGKSGTIKNKLDREYLEKYIQTQVKLSEISIERIVDYYLSDKSVLKNISEFDAFGDYRVYNLPPHYVVCRSYKFLEQQVPQYFMKRIRFRTVRNFLHEVDSILSTRIIKGFSSNINKTIDIIIPELFIKH